MCGYQFLLRLRLVVSLRQKGLGELCHGSPMGAIIERYLFSLFCSFAMLRIDPKALSMLDKLSISESRLQPTMSVLIWVMDTVVLRTQNEDSPNQIHRKIQELRQLD